MLTVLNAYNDILLTKIAYACFHAIGIICSKAGYHACSCMYDIMLFQCCAYSRPIPVPGMSFNIQEMNG